jgi:hypothetical protein
LAGTLIAESLEHGSVLEGVTLTVRKLARADVGDTPVGQPRTWTFIEFEARAEDAEMLAAALERALRPTGGWYCDFRTAEQTFVVFAGTTFRYARGDRAGRERAEAYAKSVGVPDAQLDWPS